MTFILSLADVFSSSNALPEVGVLITKFRNLAWYISHSPTFTPPVTVAHTTQCSTYVRGPSCSQCRTYVVPQNHQMPTQPSFTSNNSFLAMLNSPPYPTPYVVPTNVPINTCTAAANIPPNIYSSANVPLSSSVITYSSN